MLDAKTLKIEPADTAPAALEPGNVWCRITRMGHDKVFTGQTRALIRRDDGAAAAETPNPFPRHAFGEIVQLPLLIAQLQEDLGHLEIQD